MKKNVGILISIYLICFCLNVEASTHFPKKKVLSNLSQAQEIFWRNKPLSNCYKQMLIRYIATAIEVFSCCEKGSALHSVRERALILFGWYGVPLLSSDEYIFPVASLRKKLTTAIPALSNVQKYNEQYVAGIILMSLSRASDFSYICKNFKINYSDKNKLFFERIEKKCQEAREKLDAYVEAFRTAGILKDHK